MSIQDIILKSTFLGNLRGFQGLGVIPILTKEVPELQVLEPLESALERGLARITETSPGGEVPFLLLENSGDEPILILDGEEVVGGKQNRIINTTLVVLASTIVKVPVSCIQAGRWRHEKAHFDSAGSVFRARSRAAQIATVTANVRESGSFRSDQGAVWDEVSASLLELGVQSSTSDFREARERVANRLAEFVEAIRPAEHQIGAIFLDAQRSLGLEMLGTPVLFAKVCNKVTRSFAFEGAPYRRQVGVQQSCQDCGIILYALSLSLASNGPCSERKGGVQHAGKRHQRKQLLRTMMSA